MIIVRRPRRTARREPEGFPQPGSLERAGRRAARSTSSRPRAGSADGRGAVEAAERGDGDAHRVPADPRRAPGDRRSPTRSTPSTPSSSSIGGGVSTAGELLLRPARQVAQEFTMRGLGTQDRDPHRPLRAPRPGVRGAALLARPGARGGCSADEDRLRVRPRRRPAARDGDRRRCSRRGHEPPTSAPPTTTPTSRCAVVRARCSSGEAERGVVVCGSGAGVSVAALQAPGHPRHGGPRPLHGRRSASATTTATCSASARASSGPAIAAELVQAFAGAAVHRRGAPRAAAGQGRRRSSATDFRQTSKGADMATEATVNERLAAITEPPGRAIWLDQIRRIADRTAASSQRLVDEDSLRGVTSNPAIFEKAILGSAGLRRADRAAGARGRRRPRDLPGDRDPGRAGGLRRPARRSTTRPTATTATSRSRSTPTSRSTPSARWSRRASTGGASTAPT